MRRDLAELQDAGLDIEVTKRLNRVFAVLTAERSYSPVAITKRERFTLLAVRRVFDVFKRTPFLDDVLSVMQKLEQRMNDKERTELAAFGEQFVYMPDHGTKSHDGKDDIIDAIQSGIINRKLVRYRYGDGRGRARAGYLAPFRLAMYRHGLYAIGARLEIPTTTYARHRSGCSPSNGSARPNTTSSTPSRSRRTRAFAACWKARSGLICRTRMARTRSSSSSPPRRRTSWPRANGIRRSRSRSFRAAVFA